jgi:hypothetical protein
MNLFSAVHSLFIYIREFHASTELYKAAILNRLAQKTIQRNQDFASRSSSEILSNENTRFLT